MFMKLNIFVVRIMSTGLGTKYFSYRTRPAFSDAPCTTRRGGEDDLVASAHVGLLQKGVQIAF